MFQTKIRLNFYDCDPAGIIFFANAFRFAHSAYEQLLEKLDYRVDPFNNDKFVIPIIHSEADYKRPLKANDVIDINITAETGGSTFTLNYEFLKEGTVHVKVKTVHVFVDKKAFKKTGMPDDFRELLIKTAG